MNLSKQVPKQSAKVVDKISGVHKNGGRVIIRYLKELSYSTGFRFSTSRLSMDDPRKAGDTSIDADSILKNPCKDATQDTVADAITVATATFVSNNYLGVTPIQAVAITDPIPDWTDVRSNFLYMQK